MSAPVQTFPPPFLITAIRPPLVRVDIGDFQTTITQWVVAIPAGTKVYLSVMDSKDREAWSALVNRAIFLSLILTTLLN